MECAEDAVFINNIKKSIDQFNNGDYHSSLLYATIAVDTAARKWKGVSKSSGQIYKEFITEYYWIIEKFGGLKYNWINEYITPVALQNKGKCNNQIKDLADLIYNIYRCYSCHGKAIPENYSLFSTVNLNVTIISTNTHGKSNSSLVKPPVSIIFGLLAACIFNKASQDIKNDDDYYLTYDSSSIINKDVKQEDNKIIITAWLLKGKVTRFPFREYLGKEDEIRQFILSLPSECDSVCLDTHKYKKIEFKTITIINPMQLKCIKETLDK